MSPSSPLSLYTFHFYEVNPHKKKYGKTTNCVPTLRLYQL